MHVKPPLPLLLVDVDGVLSLFGGLQTDPAALAPGGDLVPTSVDGIPHVLSRRAARVLAPLRGTFECVWCTGWEERADEHLPTLLGLPAGWPHLSFGRGWKLPAIDAWAGPTRPLAWIDDAHGPAAPQWARTRSGPTLLVETDPAVGLTEEHGRALADWAREL